MTMENELCRADHLQPAVLCVGCVRSSIISRLFEGNFGGEKGAGWWSKTEIELKWGGGLFLMDWKYQKWDGIRKKRMQTERTKEKSKKEREKKKKVS